MSREIIDSAVIQNLILSVRKTFVRSDFFAEANALAATSLAVLRFFFIFSISPRASGFMLVESAL